MTITIGKMLKSLQMNWKVKLIIMAKYRNNYKDAEVQKSINKDILEVIKNYE